MLDVVRDSIIGARAASHKGSGEPLGVKNFLVKKNKFKLIDIKFRKLLKTHPTIKSNIQRISGKLIKKNLCVEGKLKNGKRIKNMFQKRFSKIH